MEEDKDLHINGEWTFQGLRELDRVIYRIFSARRFQDLVINRRNGLVAPRMWDDPMEDTYRSCYMDTAEGPRVQLSYIGARWYGQCWTYNRDSDAMWRIYSPDKSGVRVQTTLRRLFKPYIAAWGEEAAMQCYMGEVKYLSPEQILAHISENVWYDMMNFASLPESTIKTMLMKRPEFEHEREVRLLHFKFGHSLPTTPMPKETVVTYPFDINEVATEICFDPRMSEQDFLAEQTKYRLLGVRSKIVQSDLYKLRRFELNPPAGTEKPRLYRPE